MSSRSKKSKTSSKARPHADLAKKVVTDSLRLKPGDSVTIETWNNGLEFAKEVMKEARRAGALPILLLEDEEVYLHGLKNAPKEMIGKMGKHEMNLLSATDAYVFIPGPAIGTFTPMVPSEEGSLGTSYNSTWYETAENAGVRGVRLTFGYVGKDLAKLLGKKEEDIVLKQLKASLVDYANIREMGDPILSILAGEADGKLETSAGTLTFRLKGDTGIEDGIADEQDVASKNNISYIVPGMIWKEVDKSTASGSVKISGAVTRLGLIGESTLEFKDGTLVTWSSKDKATKQKLDALIGDLPLGKRALSMVTIGLNPALPYGYAQDRFVSGSIGISGFGLTGIVKNGTLTIGEEPVTQKGKLSKKPSSC